MNTVTKLLEAMRNNPLDWQIRQLQTVAQQQQIEWRQEGIAILPRSWKFPSLDKEGWRAAPGWFESLIP